MDRHGYAECLPKRDASAVEAPFLDFTSGYIQRSLDKLPRQGTAKPWKLHQNYALDAVALRLGRLDDGTMQFTRRQQTAKAA